MRGETLIPAKYNPRPPGMWPRFQFLSFVQLQVQPTMSERCILMPLRPKEFPSLLFQKSQIKNYRWPDGYNGPRLWSIIAAHCCDAKSKNTGITVYCDHIPPASSSQRYPVPGFRYYIIHSSSITVCLNCVHEGGRERERCPPTFTTKWAPTPITFLD